MAHCLQYELFLPVRYRDPATDELRSLDIKELGYLLSEIAERYHGFTQSNPMAAPPFRGFWKGEIDHLVYVMILVPIERADDSLAHITEWKSRLEIQYNQELLLVIFHPVQIIGTLTFEQNNEHT